MGEVVGGRESDAPSVPGDPDRIACAGDAFCAGLMYALARGLGFPAALQCGGYAAWRTLQVDTAVWGGLHGFLHAAKL